MEYLTLKNSDPQVRDLEWVAARVGRCTGIGTD